ncbi:MAG: hypothetical protein J6A01_01645 [Proteobacteria bacterium]|nr:hypothetical protein [Pseudomonadota bacterium]
MRKFCSLAVLLGVLLAGAGCEKLGPEQNSGTDKDRLGAIEINLDDLVLDFVTCLDGDKTDWKYFTVPGETDVKVTFAFDEPTAGGTIIIRKATGEEMFTKRFVAGARNTQEFHALPGHYYLEIYCEAFESEYTLEVTIPR